MAAMATNRCSNYKARSTTEGGGVPEQEESEGDGPPDLLNLPISKQPITK